MKEPIKLRQRVLRDGSVSLYLDIYSHGVRRYEFLKLYLVPEKTKQDRQSNKDTMLLAESIKAKRIIELQRGRFGFSQQGNDKLLLTYVNQLTAGRDQATRSFYHFLAEFAPKFMRVADITPSWCRMLRNHITTAKSRKDGAHLAQSTQATYWSKWVWVVHRAQQDGLIADNPCTGIESIKGQVAERVYLTPDEIRKLWHTPCRHDVLRRAFLFSCLTGLRVSDIRKLAWRDVTTMGSYTRIIFRQRKTKGIEYTDINDQAVSLMGERGKDDDLVFDGFVYNSKTATKLRNWAKAAGIRKQITYHSSRHSFALMMLDAGVDIYTTSKLLGHRDVATTMKYAHILDSKKQEAIGKLPNFQN